MSGMDARGRLQATGMDASIQYLLTMGQFWIPDAKYPSTRHSGATK